MMNQASGARISLQGVRKTFGADQPVIDGLDLAIEPGDFVTLLGPSGCGKSTLLRMIAGLEAPSAGRLAVERAGADVRRGFVFQEASLLPWRTVLANVMLPLELMGAAPVGERALSKNEREGLARDALARVGLEHVREKFPNQLSGGMKMRVSVARALVARPSLLLLDEPFAALDEPTRHRLQEDLRDLWRASGMTTVFVTHSVSEAIFLSNRSVVLAPHPARVVLDQRVDLPEERTSQLRLSARFNEQIEKVLGAFESTTGDSSGERGPGGGGSGGGGAERFA